MKDIHKFTGRMGNLMFQHAYLYAQVREGNLPDVYVQNVKYFEKYEKEIKEMFGEGIGYLPYVAIHLRVGANPINHDEPKYLENPFYFPLPTSGYYAQAIELFPHRKFIVFSDDIPFAKTYFEGDKFAFDDSESDLESFNKLASCDGHIIANSSWSFWGAYLSPNRGKVVAPTVDKWFSDGVDRVGLPKSWIRL